MSFWDPDSTEEFERAELTETLSGRHRGAGASRARLWVIGWSVGVTVGIVALGGGLLVGRYATPPVGKIITVQSTVTETSEPLVSVSTRRGWRTREIQVPGPTKWRVSVSPGPTRTVSAEPLPAVTVTKTIEVEVTSSEPNSQLPSD